MGTVSTGREVSTGQDLELRVRQIRWECDEVLSVVLEDVHGNALPAWTPGAHLDLHLPNGVVRQFSLCGRPDDPATWRCAVLREPESRGGSSYVHEHLRPGMVLTARGARNNFELAGAHRYLFIAGGIGITPILPMLRAAQESGAEWTLLYGGRRRASMAFLDELAQYGDRVLVHPQDEQGLLPLNDELARARTDTLVYCCGPAPLLAAVERACTHWPSGSLVVERFAPVPSVAGSGEDESFEVYAAQSGITVLVPEGTTILDALEASGLDIANSCRQGICGTCETKVLGGIPDHRDSLLSEDEQDSNETMMVCVSRSRNGRLVLDL